MLYGEQRHEHRKIYFDAWRKYNAKENLSDLEQQIVDLLLQHPEYHFIFENEEKYIDENFFAELGETNPFLHLSLHHVIRDQLRLDQPAAIRNLYQQATIAFGDEITAEHCIMHALALGIHEMQSQNKNFDHELYLERIQKSIQDKSWD